MICYNESLRILNSEGNKSPSVRDTMFIGYFTYEPHKYINNAIAIEKEIKNWRREKKMKLIAEMNPGLKFLNEELFGKWPPEELTDRL
jgi:putative endonuclease